MNILVTGACGVTSRAIARSLAKSREYASANLIGTDVCENVYGLYEGLFHRIYRVPWTYEDSYHSIIADICEREAVDLAIVIPELEVLYWAENEMPVRALLPPPKFSGIAISKRRVYDVLQGTGLIPQYHIISREDILQSSMVHYGTATMWMRECGEGFTSGKGAMRVTGREEMRAWALLNPSISEFMIAEYLPGRNFACCMLFFANSLLKVACYERLEYLMAKVAVSGITGNICRGRLINDSRVSSVAEQAVRKVADQTGEVMQGLVTVDLKENSRADVLLTEINLRHVACTSAFAEGGANMAEAQVFSTLGKLSEITEVEVSFPRNNLILRDVDGMPILVKNHRDIAIHECFPSRESSA